MSAENVSYKVEGTKLIIEVDLSQNFGPSSTGKTNRVASSGGFMAIDGMPGMSLSLNVAKKIAKPA